MKNAYYSATRRKSIKRKKLRCFTEWRLRRRGEKDCKNKIVRIGNNGQFSSPFLNQEICLCMVAIQNEKEMLTKILMGIDADAKAAQLRVDRRKEQISRIQGLIQEDTDEGFSDEGAGDPITDNIIKAYHECEFRARVFAKMRQVDDLRQSMENNEVRREQDIKYAESEVKITEYRCYQIYELLKARLSAYWTGVLKADSTPSSTPIPPILNVDDLVQDVKTALDNIAKG